MSNAPALAPNGLPYPDEDANPPANPPNEWAKLSPTLAKLPTDPVRSMHPFVVAESRDGVGGGMGLYVYLGIRAGEVIWAEKKNAGGLTSAVPRTRAWIEALPPAARRAYCHFMYKTGDDEYQSLAEFNDVAPERYPEVRTHDIANYMNHSCDPTCWFVDGGDAYEGVMVARRDLMPGDEITFDYGTSEDCDLVEAWPCACGAATCRGRVAPDDWSRADVQERYRGHLQPHIAQRVAAATGAAEPTPMERVDVGAAWWVRLQTESDYAPSPSQQAGVAEGLPPGRRALLRAAATGPALDLLNRQAAALIAKHRLTMRTHDRVGRYLEAGRHIDAGEVVMLLPPNLLLWDEEVTDYNRVIQMGATPEGDRLFSSSLSEHDLDNMLCHSCDPNTDVQIGPDLCVALVATRPIVPGENVCFDYDSTEDDLTGEKGGFDCACGATNCRGQVLGRQHALEPNGLPRPAAPLSFESTEMPRPTATIAG